MKGKKIDYDFVNQYITECIDRSVLDTNDIVAKAQQEINDIDEQIKKIESLKKNRSKLVDVVEVLSKKEKNSSDSLLLPLFKINNCVITRFICNQVINNKNEEEIKNSIFEKNSVCFYIKQMLQRGVILKRGSNFVKGPMFDNYIKYVLRESL